MVVKIDLEKAYDRVSWPFLEHVLHAVGFDDSMVRLIMFIVTTAKMSIVWNGKRLDTFQPSRGLRQGDPLAPYLFILCMEFLSQKIQEAVLSKRWKPIQISRQAPLVSHLPFADDILLFGETTEAQADIMAEVMTGFCNVFGQKVNTSKSSLFVSNNVTRELSTKSSTRFGIPITGDLGEISWHAFTTQPNNYRDIYTAD